MSLLNSFKLKPFELEPVYASWTDAPRFSGNPKRDIPVDEWLKVIKEGCVQRNVPKECWHKVGQNYMGQKARARLDELKNVMTKVQGGNYRWNWKKFKVAMRNMGWDLDDDATETVKVHSKRTGLWWITRKDKTVEEGNIEPPPSYTPPVQQTSKSTLWLRRTPSSSTKDSLQSESTRKHEVPSPVLEEPVTSPAFWSPLKWAEKKPQLHKTTSSLDLKVIQRGDAYQSGQVRTSEVDTVTTEAHAPTWLINATHALDFLQTEHPKVMSTVGAILITVGTIPTIPAVAAGAGGAFLASSAVHAAGAIAVGVGTWMRSQPDQPVNVVRPPRRTATTPF